MHHLLYIFAIYLNTRYQYTDTLSSIKPLATQGTHAGTFHAAIIIRSFATSFLGIQLLEVAACKRKRDSILGVFLSKSTQDF